MKGDRILVAAGIAAVLALAANPAGAQQSDPGWGTAAAAGSSARPAAGGADVEPSQTYQNANFASAGVALRNRGSGSLAISGVSGDVQAAWLYWAVITQGTPKKADTSVQISSFFPGPSTKAISIKGTAIGNGASPCWLGNTTTVYRGSVPASLFKAGGGNGLFQITLNKGASGLTDNSDPFTVLKNGNPNSPLPEMEGVSLVVVGTGSAVVALYDKNLAGQMFIASNGLSYALNLPVSPKKASSVVFAEIGADGQIFSGDLNPDTGMASKTTSINGNPIAGTGAIDPLPDWDGLTGLPIPQLWDDTEHDITAAAGSGGSTMAVGITGGVAQSGGSDCLVTVANVVEILGGSTSSGR